MVFGEEMVVEAILFAQWMHIGQQRKGGESYIEHPMRVLGKLRRLGASYTIQAAAVLHDVLEDTQVSYDELMGGFGTEVANIVRAVSHDFALSAAERKRVHITNVPNLCAVSGALHVKLADVIDNLRDRIRSPQLFESRANRGYVAWKFVFVRAVKEQSGVLDDPIVNTLLAELRHLFDEARANKIFSDEDTTPEALEAYYASCAL